MTHAVLRQILTGEIDLAYRRWKRPTVKAGSTLRTSIGMLAIDTVDRVPLSSIKAADARRAGYTTRAALLEDLRSRPTGDIYRIAVRFEGADPRIALRERTDLDADEIDELRGRLAKMDARSNRGAWTQATLELIADNPKVRAEDLANAIDVDKPTFKASVSKLKALGLTISHSPGYELSPRGHAFLSILRSDKA